LLIGGGIGSSPCSAPSARVAPTAKKPTGRTAIASTCEASTRKSGASARGAGEEGLRPLLQPFARLVTEGSSHPERAQHQHRSRDEDVVEHAGREVVV